MSAARSRPSSAAPVRPVAEETSRDEARQRDGSESGSDASGEATDEEGDPDLPAGWRRVDKDGQQYFWHVPSDTTAWERPTSDQPPT
jgi:hypothetical protein